MEVFGHGIDIVEIERIARMLEEHAARFEARCFTPKECAYAQSSPRRRVERLAARFAGKEAILKALGTGWRNGIAWTDMEILPNALGQPQLTLSGESARIAERRGICSWVVSLSHTTHYAVGSALALVP